MIDRENYEILILLDERAIEFNNKKNVVAVEGDKYSQKLTFKCPRIYDGVDLSEKNVFINYKTSIGLSDIVRVYIEDEDIDEDYIYFIWDLDSRVCNQESKVTFSVNFLDKENNYSLYTKTGFFKVEATLRIDIINTEEELLNYYTIINNIGDLQTLETNEKSSMVGAINEVHADVENNYSELERLQYYGDKNILPTSQDSFEWIIRDGVAHVSKYIGDKTEVVIPYKYIDEAEQTYVVGVINAYVFQEYTSLKKIILPNSITYIGASAFNNCSSLKEITIPDKVTYIGDYAFYKCSSLINIKIPNSVTRISFKAFGSCNGLVSATIPDDILNIAEDAFRDCSKLTIICSQGSYAETYAKGNNIPYIYTEVEPVVGDLSDLNTTDKTTVVGAINEVNAKAEEELERLQYYGDKNIVPTAQSKFTWEVSDDGFATVKSYSGEDTSLVIPYEYIDDRGASHKVTAIGTQSIDDDGIFFGRENLTSVIIPSSVTEIGANTFTGCPSLTKVVIPDSVTVIGQGAFGWCTSLTNVVIPSSVTAINISTFETCLSLTNIVIPNSVTRIDNLAFCETALEKVIIPNSVTAIGESAFNNCDNLTIICEQGSYAETYAKENNKPYIYDVVKPEIGDLSDLETTDKSSIVSAINEVRESAVKAYHFKGSTVVAGIENNILHGGYIPQEGDVYNIWEQSGVIKAGDNLVATGMYVEGKSGFDSGDTDNKTYWIQGYEFDILSGIVDLSGYYDKTSVDGMINTINGSIGNLADLTTIEQGSIVDAINELDSSMELIKTIRLEEDDVQYIDVLTSDEGIYLDEFICIVSGLFSVAGNEIVAIRSNGGGNYWLHIGIDYSDANITNGQYKTVYSYNKKMSDTGFLSFRSSSAVIGVFPESDGTFSAQGISISTSGINGSLVNSATNNLKKGVNNLQVFTTSNSASTFAAGTIVWLYGKKVRITE